MDKEAFFNKYPVGKMILISATAQKSVTSHDPPGQKAVFMKYFFGVLRAGGVHGATIAIYGGYDCFIKLNKRMG